MLLTVFFPHLQNIFYSSSIFKYYIQNTGNLLHLMLPFIIETIEKRDYPALYSHQFGNMNGSALYKYSAKERNSCRAPSCSWKVRLLTENMSESCAMA
ncbi:hypothetical protein Cop2CBH44_08670 [Coprobacter secundus subsp. similis]|uniref:Uncharacterized protein n=1 Tax=Coprobacter secundus subsp. similis TaxID=2751153 RepID=A0A7G1HVU0_9BACT|nr:hypothetical protein Cop2CBH44_08670 [Coprobacter secundus subsp. similis]